MPEIEVRTGTVDDFESLSAIEHGYNSEHVWQVNLNATSESAGAVFQRIRLPRRIFVPYPRQRKTIFSKIGQEEDFLIAVLADQSVGYIKTSKEENAEVARVLDLVVSTPFRRQGIASGLVLAMMEYIRHQNCHTMVLQMQSKNDPAISMAFKLGFYFCGFMDHFFPNNDLSLFFSRPTR